jgi:hypothetical protein
MPTTTATRAARRPLVAAKAVDEFGHGYVSEWDFPLPDGRTARVAVAAWSRHPGEDTSREYTRAERRRLGICWRYVRYVVTLPAGQTRMLEWFAFPVGAWVAGDRTYDRAIDAVDALAAAA